MIDAKQAILIAKQQATQMSLPDGASLEEIEREEYKGRDVWSITLGFPRNPVYLSPLHELSGRLSLAGRIDYKRFLISADSGEFVAMKLRELANV